LEKKKLEKGNSLFVVYEKTIAVIIFSDNLASLL